MNMFQKAIQDGPLLCDICGREMVVMPGGGWDNDRIYCPGYDDCGAEVVYPTSTEVAE